MNEMLDIRYGVRYYYTLIFWGCSSVGRALEWHSRGRRFDPDQLHKDTNTYRDLNNLDSDLLTNLCLYCDIILIYPALYRLMLKHKLLPSYNHC